MYVLTFIGTVNDNSCPSLGVYIHIFICKFGLVLLIVTFEHDTHGCQEEGCQFSYILLTELKIVFTCDNIY